MGQSTFPIPSSGSSTSTVLPVNASSVILDGSLTSGTTYTTTVNGNGGIAYLTSTANMPPTVTISGTAYTVANNTTVASKAFGASTSVTVTAGPSIPSTFYSMSPPSASNALYAVGFGNGYFVAANYNSTVGAYSTDGITWLTSTMPSASAWLSFAYGNGYLVAIAQGLNGAYSTNGTTWTATTMPSNSGWSGAAYGFISGNNTFVTVAGTTVGAYGNGTTWTAMTMPSSNTWNSVTFGNGTFIAVASSVTAGASSTNGTTWTARTMPSASGWRNNGTTYGLNGATPTFVAVTTTTVGAYSTNGTSWSAMTMPSSINWSVGYGNGYFVAVGSNTSVYSTNGTSWTIGTAPTGGWLGVAYGNSTFVTVSGFGSGGAYYSFTNLPVNFGIYAGPTTIN